MKKVLKGFTLVELLVVIGILAVLTAIVLVAVNPGRQFMQARDTQRRADVNTISAAIVAFLADPDSTATQTLAGLGVTAECITPATQAIGTVVGGVDLEASVSPMYIAAIPLDPSGGDATDTGYTICINDASASRFTITAPGAELATSITVTR